MWAHFFIIRLARPNLTFSPMLFCNRRLLLSYEFSYIASIVFKSDDGCFFACCVYLIFYLEVFSTSCFCFRYIIVTALFIPPKKYKGPNRKQIKNLINQWLMEKNVKTKTSKKKLAKCQNVRMWQQWFENLRTL